MFEPRSDRVAMVAGNLFFLVAIALFVTLILLATGTVGAQEYLLTDSLEPDALEADALEPDALEVDALRNDALGLERIDPELFLQRVELTTGLPIAVIPPRPRQAIPMYFCWSCWEWHPGIGGGPAWQALSDDYQWINGFIYPVVPGERVPPRGGKLEKKAKKGEKK